MPFDAVAYKMVNDRTNDITAMKNGKALWTGTITVPRTANRAWPPLTGLTKRGRSLRPRPFTIKNSSGSRLRLAVAGLRRGGQSAKGRTRLGELRISEFRVPVRLDDRDLVHVASLQLGKKVD